jgi:hypothetical protein
MVSKVKGSAFDFGDQGCFYSVIDFGARTTYAAGQNNTAITTALTAIKNAGGGVLMVPHGITQTFNPATDFPATANALMVWILTGNSFLVYSNQNITSDFGDTFAAAVFTTPSAVEYRVIDTNPPVYTFKMKVADAGIAGSTSDLGFYLPGASSPTAAFARNGSKLGALFCFAGLDVTGLTEVDTLTVSGTTTLSGALRTTKDIQAPTTGASIQIADVTRSLVLNHSATIATLTITLPQAPVDGQSVEIFSRSIVTTLTLNAGTGETIETGHTLATLTALQNVCYIFNSGDSKWYRTR